MALTLLHGILRGVTRAALQTESTSRAACVLVRNRGLRNAKDAHFYGWGPGTGNLLTNVHLLNHEIEKEFYFPS